MAKAKHQSLKQAAKPANRQLKRVVKSAKNAAKSGSTKSKVSNIREHIEKFSDLSGDRRDCAGIWMLIKGDNSKYKTDEEIKNLIKAKGYETLLGEIS